MMRGHSSASVMVRVCPSDHSFFNAVLKYSDRQLRNAPWARMACSDGPTISVTASSLSKVKFVPVAVDNKESLIMAMLLSGARTASVVVGVSPGCGKMDTEKVVFDLQEER